MESFLITIAPELITLASTILIALAGWGIALLRQKVKAEVPEHTLGAANSALSVIDGIISAIVGNLAQTAAKKMREVSKDGHLSKDDKIKLKRFARDEVTQLISLEVTNAAREGVKSLDSYISKRIEETVLDLKGGK